MVKTNTAGSDQRNPDYKSSKGKSIDSRAMVKRFESFLENACRMMSNIYPDMDANAIHKGAFSHFNSTDCCQAVLSVKKVLGEPLDLFLSQGKISEVLPFHYLKKRKDVVGALATWAGCKKGMPDPCGCSKEANVKSFVDRSQTKFVSNANYNAFVYRTVISLFSNGEKITKKKYEAKVASNSPSFNGCTEATRKDQGSFGCLTKVDMDKYSRGEMPISNFECKLDTIVSSGKVRTLVKTPASWQSFRPLHELIYDKISKEKWLLRGEPSLSSVSRIKEGMGKKEVFLSGDYESATDCLSIEVAELILRAIKDASPNFCPDLVWQAAFKSLRPFIHAGVHGRYQPSRGQMMGSLLSFPLLCLQNYCATLYILGDRPMLINGDDLLTRVTHEEYKRWCDIVPTLGLKPSLGKCGISRSFFTINSDYFRTYRGEIRRLPFGRLKTLLKKQEGVPDFPAYIRARGGLNPRRVGFDRCWIECMTRHLYATRRPIQKLGYPLVKCAVPRHLQVREFSYENVPVRDMPSGPSPRSRISMEGWELMSSRYVPSCIKDLQGPIWVDLKERARGKVSSVSDVWERWWEEVRLSGVNTCRFTSSKPSLFKNFNKNIKKTVFDGAGRVTRRLAGIEKKLKCRPTLPVYLCMRDFSLKSQAFKRGSAT